jgi:hypothetical protein
MGSAHLAFPFGEPLRKARGTSEKVSLLVIARLALQPRRVLLGTALSLLVLVTGFTLMQARTYTSSAVFMPQSSRTLLKGLISLIAGLLIGTFVVALRQTFPGPLPVRPMPGGPAGPVPIEQAPYRQALAPERGSTRVHGDSSA